MHRRLPVIFVAFALLAGSAFGITTGTNTHKKHRRIVRATTAAAKAVKKVTYTDSTRVVATHLTGTAKKRKVASPWATPTFADSTQGDSVDGEDLLVRRAAVQALGPLNGSG